MSPDQTAYAAYMRSMNQQGKPLIVVPYFGGKARMRHWILSKLPPLTHYIEPFGGSAVVLLNRPRSIGREIYSELSRGMVEMFTELRDNPELLIWKLRGTLYSRQIFDEARERMAVEDAATPIDTVTVAGQSFNAKMSTNNTWRVDKGRPIEKSGRTTPAETDATRVGMDAATISSQAFHGSSMAAWAYSKDGSRIGSITATTLARRQGAADSAFRAMEDTPLYRAAERLQGVEIYRANALDVLREWRNESDALLYLDPPYVPDSRKSARDYQYEMTFEQHEEMLELCAGARAYIAISGYDSELYLSALSKFKVEMKDVSISSAVGVNGVSGESNRAARTEILWTNYDVNDWRPQQGSLL